MHHFFPFAEAIQKKLVGNLSRSNAFLQRVCQDYADYAWYMQQAQFNTYLNSPEAIVLAKFAADYALSKKDDPTLNFTAEEKAEMLRIQSQANHQLNKKTEKIHAELGDVEAEDFKKVLTIAPLLYAALFQKKDSDDYHFNFNKNMNTLYNLKFAQDDVAKQHAALRKVGTTMTLCHVRISEEDFAKACAALTNNSISDLKDFPKPDKLQEHFDAFQRLLNYHSSLVDVDYMGKEKRRLITEELSKFYSPSEITDINQWLDAVRDGTISTRPLGEKRRIMEALEKISHDIEIKNGLPSFALAKLAHDIGEIDIFDPHEHSKLTTRKLFMYHIKALEEHFEEVAYSRAIETYQTPKGNRYHEGRDSLNEHTISTLNNYFRLKKIFHRDIDAAYYQDMAAKPDVSAMLEYMEVLEKPLDYTKRVLAGEYDQEEQESSQNHFNIFDDNEPQLRSDRVRHKIWRVLQIEELFDENRALKDDHYERFKAELAELKQTLLQQGKENAATAPQEWVSAITLTQLPQKLAKDGSNRKLDEEKVKALVEALNNIPALQNMGVYATIPFPAVRYAVEKGVVTLEIAAVDATNLPEAMKRLPDFAKTLNAMAKTMVEAQLKARYRLDCVFTSNDGHQK